MPALLTPSDVQNGPEKQRPDLFAEYCQQTLGTPWPTNQDRIILRKKVKEFFAHYPHADWYTLCRVVMFARSRKRRYERVWAVIGEFRKAYTAGVLPELDPANRVDEKYEMLVSRALETEDDPYWRKRLLLAQGPQKEEVYVEWRKTEWYRNYLMTVAS